MWLSWIPFGWRSGRAGQRLSSVGTYLTSFRLRSNILIYSQLPKGYRRVSGTGLPTRRQPRPAIFESVRSATNTITTTEEIRTVNPEAKLLPCWNDLGVRNSESSFTSSGKVQAQSHGQVAAPRFCSLALTLATIDLLRRVISSPFPDHRSQTSS